MSDEQVKDEIFGIIDNIFGNASTIISDGGSGNIEVQISEDETEAVHWKQYSKSWGNIKRGSSRYTIKSAHLLTI